MLFTAAAWAAAAIWAAVRPLASVSSGSGVACFCWESPLPPFDRPLRERPPPLLPPEEEPPPWSWATGSEWTMMPRPEQCSQVSEKTSMRPAPTRLRVICTRPSEVTSATWCFVRSRPRHSRRRRTTRSRLVSRTMSMKSTTMIPPMSRRRSCRTISSAASRLFFVTVSSRLPPAPVNFPVLTSTTVIASVRSMTREPPEGSHTLRSIALAIASSMRCSLKTSLSPVYFSRRSERSGATSST